MPGKIGYTELETPPEEHEVRVAKYFSRRGKDIKFIKPSNIPAIHTPDFYMDGVEWEVKSPQGDSSLRSKRELRNCWSLRKMER